MTDRKKLKLAKNINCLKCDGRGNLGGIGGFLECDVCGSSGSVNFIYWKQLKDLNEKILDLQYKQKEILTWVLDIE